ncbi:MAG: helix-turn-helix domain-containing protein, partial [Gemmatimonadaceae bacterium]
DGKRILLAKLSQGGIGEENSHLLGSLIVAKTAQAAMSRQDEALAKRVPFFLYMDEFHHFITPSIAAILSGARKYGLGLTLAHQEMRQLKSQSEEIASAVLANAFTRVVFRVGDQDAKTLAEGFSFFEAKDLQNLGTGEAIARIERPDFDFNLRTLPLPTVPVETGRARRQAVLNASRARYAIPRADVEASLRADQDDHRTSTATPEDKPRRKRRAEKDAQGASTAPHGDAEAPPTMPGRGGVPHKYLQSLLKRFAEDRGFVVSTEKRVLDGHGHVDVALEKDGLAIACEISVSTGVPHEAANLTKCLAAGFNYALLISTDERFLDAAQRAMGDTDSSRVSFLTPKAFPAFLDGLDGKPDPSRAAPPERTRKDAGALPTDSPAQAPAAMMSPKEAGAYVRLAPQTLAKLRCIGGGPPFYKLGRQVGYKREDLDAWLEAKRRRSTSDPGPVASVQPRRRTPRNS